MRRTAIAVERVIVAALAAGAIIGCSAKQATVAAHTAPASAVTIPDQDNGKSIEVAKRQTLLVRRASNPMTGYQWTLQGAPAPLELIKSDFAGASQSKDLAGAGGIQTVQLTAKSAGSAALQLDYRRSWEKAVPAAKTFAVTVIVK